MKSTPFGSAADAIDRMLTERHRQGFGPGLSLALTTRDKLVATKTYGVANADRGDPSPTGRCSRSGRSPSTSRPLPASGSPSRGASTLTRR